MQKKFGLDINPCHPTAVLRALPKQSVNSDNRFGSHRNHHRFHRFEKQTALGAHLAATSVQRCTDSERNDFDRCYSWSIPTYPNDIFSEGFFNCESLKLLSGVSVQFCTMFFHLPSFDCRPSSCSSSSSQSWRPCFFVAGRVSFSTYIRSASIQLG